MYRYILYDLIRLMAMAAAVLVILLSFGTAIKTISEGLLGPWELAKFIVFLIPCMLSFAIPFAAAFGATLVFFRLAADNEITACSASGISYSGLLLPIIILGIILTLTMFFLSNWIVPGFWIKVTNIAEKDVTRMIVSRINSREPFVFSKNGLILYADSATSIDPPKPSQNSITPYRRIILKGAAVGKLDKTTHSINANYTGETAWADLYRQNNRHYITVKLTNAAFKDPISGILINTHSQEFGPYEFSLPMQLKPKFLSLTILRQMVVNPDINPDIEENRRSLLKALIKQRTIQYLQNSFKPTLKLLSPDNSTCYITAPVIKPTSTGLKLNADTNDIILRKENRTFKAKSARLNVTVPDNAAEPYMTLILNNVSISDPNLPIQASRKELPISHLRLNHNIASTLTQQSSDELLQHSSVNPTPYVEKAAITLTRRINNLRLDIRSRLNERAAMAVSCAAVMILAALMAMLLRNQNPLTIFFWCFLPTIICIVLIDTGQNVMHSARFHETLGLSIIWSGIALMLIMAAITYKKLNRN